MPLTPGTRLGPYEITEAIGRGGMGEVFRARDSRLGRDVAIKTSAQRFSERFEREARAIAALNHPNICTLFDVGSSPDAPSYLVMELVDGPTLAERIQEGPLPVAEAEQIAMQIAQALEAAHEKAITHRDLKPGNVKLREDGSVKVLDFGLAKVGHTPTADVSDNSPTLTVGMTEVGMILGTAAYMAPEQARGKAVDHRADIFAFGVVLHEMLTGKKLFQGEDLTEVLASVVKDQPDLTVVPARMRKLLAACLQKDPRKRLQSIGDAKLLLVDDAPVVTAPPTKSSWLPWAVAAGLTVALGIALWAPWRSDVQQEEPALNLPVAPPIGKAALQGLLSPDGKHMLVLHGYNEPRQVLTLATGEYRDLPGTEVARTPFWSADARFIAFFKDGRLKVTPALGGPVQELCGETGLGQGGSWHANGTVLFGSDSGAIRQVKVTDGVREGSCKEALTAEDLSRQFFPTWLPDGERFFFTVGSTDTGKLGVYLAGPDGTPPRRILTDFSSVLYIPPDVGESLGQILFRRNSTSMAQPFDPESLTMEGDPVELFQNVAETLSPPEVSTSVAANGLMAYTVRSLRGQLTSLDRRGTPIQKYGTPADYYGPNLSPDGSRVLVIRRNAERLMVNLKTGSETRFDTKATSAKWSPDNAWVAFYDRDAGGLVRQSSTGGPVEMLVPSKVPLVPSQWTADNRWLFFTDLTPQTRGGIWYLPNPGTPGGKPVKFLDTAQAVESQAQLSPGGNWVAYSSDESGRTESYLCHFPECGSKQQIGSEMREPLWSKNGKELFFFGGLVGGTFQLMVSEVRPGISLGPPQGLFRFRSYTIVAQGNSYSYAPSPDGQSFLIALQGEESAPRLNLVTNWRRLLQKPDGR